jgi:hypothetical protein
MTCHLATGVMVMLHDNRQLPLIELAGMALGPGLKHRITFTRKSAEFLRPPYTGCTDKIHLAMQAMFNRYQQANYSYSQFLCFTNCIQEYTYVNVSVVVLLLMHVLRLL